MTFSLSIKKGQHIDHVDLETDFVIKARDEANKIISAMVLQSKTQLLFTMYRDGQVFAIYTGGRWYYPAKGKDVREGDYILTGATGTLVRKIEGDKLYFPRGSVRFSETSAVYLSKVSHEPIQHLHPKNATP